MCVTIKFCIQLTHKLLQFQYNICYHWNNRCVVCCETKGKLDMHTFFKRNQAHIKLWNATLKIITKGSLTEGVSSKWDYLTIMLLIESQLKIWGKWNVIRTLALCQIRKRKGVILKDLGKFKVMKQKITIYKSELGINNDFTTLLSMPSVLDVIPLLQ